MSIMTAQQLYDFQSTYKNQWVARDISTEEVVDADRDLALLMKRLQKRGVEYVLEHILPPDVLYAPFAG